MELLDLTVMKCESIYERALSVQRSCLPDPPAAGKHPEWITDIMERYRLRRDKDARLWKGGRKGLPVPTKAG
jgi:hypothetical protein